ncbi:MAG: DUF2834 domain-containing protein [Maritimibacter sp.]|nr:DUF2834 domain-containing protein [Maritimibacter sp.]
MSGLRITYLVLAVIGAAVPLAYFVGFFQAEGWSLGLMIDAWRANGATKGAAMDLVISGLVLSIWCIAETLVRRNWIALAAIPATFLVGVSFGLPLYLFLRTRPVD